MSFLQKVNAKTVNDSTPIDSMDQPPGMTNKKLNAVNTAKARPLYSRVTHRAIGSKGHISKAPPKRMNAPKKNKLPFNHPKV